MKDSDVDGIPTLNELGYKAPNKDSQSAHPGGETEALNRLARCMKKKVRIIRRQRSLVDRMADRFHGRNGWRSLRNQRPSQML